MNIPNILTSFRLFLIPIFILVFFSSNPHAFTFSVMIFFVAGLTDMLDGYIARKYNLVTKLGIVLDPFADKLMLLTILTCLVIKNYIPSWILIIVATKDLFMIIIGSVLFKKDIIIPANKLGKISTFVFYFSIFMLSFDINVGKYFLYLAALVAVAAFVNYLILYKNYKKANK